MKQLNTFRVKIYNKINSIIITSMMFLMFESAYAQTETKSLDVLQVCSMD